MWILVFVVLIEVQGIDTVTALEKYTTKELCQSEKARILIEMEKSYPGDTSWTLECRFRGQHA